MCSSFLFHKVNFWIRWVNCSFNHSLGGYFSKFIQNKGPFLFPSRKLMGNGELKIKIMVILSKN